METRLTDEQLHAEVYGWVKKLCETGGQAWCLRVPADHNKDPDLLITELINRHKACTTPPTPQEGIVQTPFCVTVSGEPEDRGQTAEDFLYKNLVYGKNTYIAGQNDRVIKAMNEYASQSRIEARRQAIQEAESISFDTEDQTGFKFVAVNLDELREKLKK